MAAVQTSLRNPTLRHCSACNRHSYGPFHLYDQVGAGGVMHRRERCNSCHQKDQRLGFPFGDTRP